MKQLVKIVFAVTHDKQQAMAPHFLTKVPLKFVIALSLLIMGLVPLTAVLVLNVPIIISKLEQLNEAESINILRDQVADLEKAIEHRKANLLTITALPGTTDLFSDPSHRILDRPTIIKRLSFMFNHWLSEDSAVRAILLADKTGKVMGSWGQGADLALVQIPQNHSPTHIPAEWLEESKKSPLDTIFVAGMELEIAWEAEFHDHFPVIILGIPGKDKNDAYGGAIFMKVSLASYIKTLPYQLIVNGEGKVIHRYEQNHDRNGAKSHGHQHTPLADDFPDIATTVLNSSPLILTNRLGQKTAFIKIIDEPHPAHTIWLTRPVQTGELETWFNSFVLRFVLILSALLALAIGLTLIFTARAEGMRRQLVSGLGRLIQEKEPLALGWQWPAEIKELSNDIELLARNLLEADASLRQNERFLQSILDGIQDGISVLDHDLTIIDTNQTIEGWYKNKLPLAGQKCHEVYRQKPYPCEDCPSLAAMRQGVLQRSETQWQVGSEEKWLEIYAYPVRDEQGQVTKVVEFIRDISDRKKAQADRDSLANQLALSQKMEAVGTLAGGVAHDFNNILSAINGYAEMCLMQMEEDNPLHGKINIILQSGQRAAGLTQQLLAFSRKQIIHPQSINVNLSLENIRKMLSRILGEDIEINTVAQPGLWPVLADQTQFEQVIINMAVNARDAMPRGGKLTFETKNITLDEKYVERHYEIAAGDYVLLAISDNGTGMDKETMAKIFEPFFSTKEKGKGTGLGLATVYGIVKQNQGEILVYSEPGQGTTFKIYLPRLQGSPAVQGARKEPSDLIRGTETILLVEDDDVVRTMSVEILSSLGYSILEAADGEEALQTCRRYHGHIDLILTDVVMPKMDGAHLVKKVSKLRPDIKVLFMSGYTDDAVVRHGILKDDVHFLQKPVTPTTLTKALRAALNGM